MSQLERLQRDIPQTGRVTWIGYAAVRRGAVTPMQQVEVCVGTGLAPDHHCKSGRGDSPRQVTLLQSEHLPVVAALLGRASIDPALLRRNVVVAGINVWALRGLRFRLGELLLEGTGPCAPCSRMEESLGPGGYHAMRGHGGITARVLAGGLLRVGDPVRVDASAG